jgi:hypothetical protein
MCKEVEHDSMDEINRDEGEKLDVSQHLMFERSPTARLEAKPAPDAMSLEMRITKNLLNIDHPHGGDSSSDEYCLELLRRAILQEDQDAWQVAQQCLNETVRGWLVRHPKRVEACRLDREENYIARAFVRFYQGAVLRKGELSQLHFAILYLRMSLNSAILDMLRASSRPRKPCDLDTSTRAHEVWEMLDKMLLSDREQRVAYLLFHYELGPKDIVRTFPEEFNDVREISLLRNIIIVRLLDYEDRHNGTNDASRNANSTKDSQIGERRARGVM